MTNRQVIHRMPEGFILQLDPVEWGQLETLEFDWRERKTIKLIKTILKPGDTFVDVGAHIGSFGLLAESITGKAGKTVLVEPQPENQVQILENLKLNYKQHLSLWCCALGPVNGKIKIAAQPDTDREKLSLNCAQHGRNYHYYVSCFTLDTILENEEISSPSVIKIDIEGYEYEALRNFNFDRYKPQNLIIEFLQHTRESDDGKRLLNLLTVHNYEIMNVEGIQYAPDILLPDENLWCRLKKLN